MIRINKFKKRSSIFLLTATVLIASLFLISSALSSVQYEQSEESGPWFNVDVAYAFVGKGPYEAPHSHFDGILHYPKSQYPSSVYFNVTHCSNTELRSCDAVIEVYLIQIISDKGSTERYVWFEGTNYNISFSDSDKDSLTTHIYDLVDLNTINGVRGHFRYNWTENVAVLGGTVGSFGSYSSCPSELGLWKAGKPNTISVIINGIGYVKSTNGSISVHSYTASKIATYQLKEHVEGFILNNNMVDTDKLSQINLFQPLG
jgi:hypothetical protein